MAVVQVVRRFVAIAPGPMALALVLGLGLGSVSVAAASERAEQERVPGVGTALLALDVALVAFDRKDIDDSFAGVGIGLTARPTTRLAARLRMERVEEYDADELDGVSVHRMRMGLAFRDPVTATIDAVYEFEVGYTSASSEARDFEVFDGVRSYLEYGVQVGMSGSSERWRTDLMAVARTNNDSDIDNQLGGRLEITGYAADFRYAGFIEGEMLTDDRTVRLGVRRMFH
ncbi:hypothetical protein CKO15_09350 [Halorhodospira abdelmalekii]|uniref:hypothetical protein n=1 Tax=Halorhodospira abdelmalekii TaxID=421629 RepID=UPI00190381CF|nr:hypothetical protein [Halorhodospira abdelmalekii]MBK1735484.1 hypothetical protein [Halorhodospira abdelmalekii]